MIRARPEVEAAPAPVHGGPPGQGGSPVRTPVLDFSHNVNAWGPAPEVRAAVRGAELASYPDPSALGPREAVARRWRLPVEGVRFGPGAAELIHRTCRVFVRAGEPVVVAEPTFSEYARAAILAGARVVPVRGQPPEYGLPLRTLARTVAELQPRLVFVCAPNSPTGEDPGLEGLGEVAESLPDDGLLVVDDSFRSFAAGTFAPPGLRCDPRVLALRSLTKDFALAGLRAGVISGTPELLRSLDAAEVPWSTSAPAQAAAVAALGEGGIRHLEGTVARLRSERPQLAEGLRRRGWDPLPSVTNFLLCRVRDRPRTVAGLLRRGIRVRDCTSFGLPDHVRVAVRTPSENDALLEAVEALE